MRLLVDVFQRRHFQRRHLDRIGHRIIMLVLLIAVLAIIWNVLGNR
jgi:hypothetical protein